MFVRQTAYLDSYYCLPKPTCLCRKSNSNKVGSLKKMDNNPAVWSLNFILQLPCIQLTEHTIMTSVPGLVGRGTRTKLDVASEVA